MRFFFALVLCLWSAGVSASDVGYPIVVSGERVLIGEPIGFVKAYAYRGGQFKEIRLQIDEVNARGDYVLAKGLPYTARSDNGYFDANDELVLWSLELGDAYASKDIPASIRKKAARMWRVTAQRREQVLGHALIVSLRQPAKKSGKRLVTYDEKSEKVETKVYRYSFHKERAALLGKVELRDGDRWRPAIRNSTFVMALRLPWYLPDFDFGESNFISTVESWQSGSIRTIVAVGVKLRRFLSLFDFHMFSELVFYENALQIPTVIEFTFDPSKYFERGTGLAYAIEFEPGSPWDTTANFPALPNAEPKEGLAKVGRADDFDRFVVESSSAPFGVDVSVRVDEKARKLAPPPLVFGRSDLESESQVQNWEWLGDLRGDLGVFVEISGVRKGIYDFGLDLILHPKADVERVTELGTFSTKWSRLQL